MKQEALHAISPIDGRYSEKTEAYAAYFSEFALMRYRLMVEVEYFIALCELPLPQLESLDGAVFADLRSLYLDFDDESAKLIKAIERQTNHDVKAVEYFLRERLEEMGLSAYGEFVHFGLTSQDINNTAFPFMLRDASNDLYYPQLAQLIDKLKSCAEGWAEIPMLAHTHGQPASPTRLGKEMLVFVSRLTTQVNLLRRIPMAAKFGGAVGNFNAHHVAYPDIDWVAFADRFVNDKLGLQRSPMTTQIDNYDNLAAIFDAMRRVNTILIDFCRDVWAYIAMDYFRQAVVPGEVGSSTMPHKVNPIDFENAEGNLGIANVIFAHLAEKLPVSRLQRDLTDSTVIRNIGVPLAHTAIAMQSIMKGLSRISVHREVILADLESHWVVVAEGIQTILRREGYPEAYELLKGLTRTEHTPRRQEFEEFIEGLDVRPEVKRELLAITPFNYTGICPSHWPPEA